MNIFHIPANFVDRLGWVLVHSAWQFALIALVALLLVRATRGFSAASRYWLLLLAFAAMVAAPVVTLLVIPVDESSAVAATTDQIGPAMNAARLGQDGAAPAEPVGNTRPIAGGDARELPTKTTPTLSWRSIVDQAVRPWLSVIVSIWGLGVLAFAWRPLLSWHTVCRLRSVGVSPVPAAVAAMLQQTADRLRLRQTVQILQSTLTRVPVVIGYLRPVILLPVSVIAGVPNSQLEAILAHELAHVRRHDFLVNLLQTLVETLFFYHPAVWWLSHRIRVERENCCDDLAVAAIGNRVEYGRALLALVEIRGTTTALALGARSGSLLDRVRRLFGGNPAERSMGAGSVVGVGLLALMIIAAGVWNATQADDDGATRGTTAKLDGDIEIKLLGVSYQPSENQPWWTPEGAALPGDPLTSRWKSGKTHVHDEGEHRELALEVTGAERNIHALVDFAPGDKLGMWSTFSNYQDDEQTKKKVTLIRAVSAGFPKDQKQRDVLVRLATAPWHPDQVIDVKGDNPHAEEKPGDKASYRYRAVQLRRVQEQADGTTQVDLAFPENFELRAYHEVVGEDLDGNKVTLYGTTIADAGARGCIFRCPLDRLAKVRVRIRWYTHEVMFRNVSLHPQQVTQVKAKVAKLKPPPEALLMDVFEPIPDAVYARPTADDQRATATIPAEAWGKPVDGLRVAIVLRSPPVDKDQRLRYDIVAENVSDHDIRFSADVGIDTWHFHFKTKLVDADGKQVPQGPEGISFLGTGLNRFWLKPKERGVIFSSWASQLVMQDEAGQPFAKPSSFIVKPGRYSVSAAMEFGPGWSGTDPVSGKRTVLSPAEGEWSGKLETGAVPVALFTQPAPADEAAAKYPPIEFRSAVAAAREALLVSLRDEHPPIEFRIAVGKVDRDADGVAWFPIKVNEQRGPAPAGESGANLPIEERLDDQWRGLLWDKAEHALLADGTWRVVKCDVAQSAQSTDLVPNFEIRITVDAAGGASLRRLTSTHVNQSLAIVVDGTIIATPVVTDEFGEDFVITGTFSKADAEKFAAAIRKPDSRKKPTSNESVRAFVLRFAEAKSAVAAMKAEAALREIHGFEATIDPRLNSILIIADADTMKALAEILRRLDSKNATSTVISPADLGPEHDGKEVTMIFKITDTQLIGGEHEGEFPHVKLHYVGMKNPPYLGVYVKGELADVLHRSACVAPDDRLVGRSIKASGKIKIHKDFPKGEDQTPIYYLDLRDWKKFQILPEPTGK